MKKGMNAERQNDRLDFYIGMQLNMSLLELSGLVITALISVLVQLNGAIDISHLVLGFLWPVCTVLAIWLSFRALRKIFYTSVYGQTSALYQSLPLSPGILLTGKIFAAGCILIPAALSVFWTPVSCIGSILFGPGEVRMILTNVLVSLGYHQTTAPLFVALALVAAVLGCFAMASTIQFVIAAYHGLASRPGKLSLAIVGILLTVILVVILNLAPYLLLLSGEKVPHPAMLPAAGILLNVGVLLAAGRGSARLLASS